ncbi:MAG: hypothetical protein KME11_12510 [Timaviella obliquedivisa GSE-PSE-MK23-08B]|jgi:hypothetical protein|nr:hypothetical protein [Timaviella obliquedivisa GSE-PSE-MK23-08B]
MLIQRILERVSKPEPAMTRTGYWVSGAGAVLTILVVLGSFFAPSIRGSALFKIPPCLILAGLALEGYEAIAQSKRGNP